MNEYELDGNQLVPRESASEGAEMLDQERQTQSKGPTSETGMSGIEKMLAAARARLRRLSPINAMAALEQEGTILVDIRPERQRAIEGEIAGALIIERNVLEWRLDPTSNSRLSVATSHDLRVIVFCSEGYTSSLAAAALQDLGLWRATDLVGGFRAWRKAGLPTVPSSDTSQEHFR
jgi:rhodanese-related sulfurtransferase